MKGCLQSGRCFCGCRRCSNPERYGHCYIHEDDCHKGCRKCLVVAERVREQQSATAQLTRGGLVLLSPADQQTQLRNPGHRADHPTSSLGIGLLRQSTGWLLLRTGSAGGERALAFPLLQPRLPRILRSYGAGRLLRLLQLLRPGRLLGHLDDVRARLPSKRHAPGCCATQQAPQLALRLRCSVLQCGSDAVRLRVHVQLQTAHVGRPWH